MSLHSLLSVELERCENERTLKPFLDNNIVLIRNTMNANAWNCVICKPQFKLGTQYIADYVIVSANSGQWYVTLIEVQSHKAKLFTKDGKMSKDLNEAHAQITEWKTWVDEHNDDFRDRVSALVKNQPAFCSNANIHSSAEGEIRDKKTIVTPKYKILIGRRSELTQDLNARRSRLVSAEDEIVTFDRLLNYAQQNDL